MGRSALRGGRTGGAVAVALALATGAAAEAPVTLSFPTADGGTVVADLYDGAGPDAVVLAHGAVFDKASWRPLAERLVARGLRVLAIDFRGYGRSAPGTKKDDGRFEDVLAAVRQAHTRGAQHVAVLGASMGGRAAAEAAAAAKPGEIDRLILLSPAGVPEPERVRAPTTVVASADEPAAGRIRDEFARLPDPKRLVLLPGAAHAQRIFETEQAARLTETLVDAVLGH